MVFVNDFPGRSGALFLCPSLPRKSASEKATNEFLMTHLTLGRHVESAGGGDAEAKV